MFHVLRILCTRLILYIISGVSCVSCICYVFGERRVEGGRSYLANVYFVSCICYASGISSVSSALRRKDKEEEEEEGGSMGRVGDGGPVTRYPYLRYGEQ